jgi:phospholipid/cholesterol/gamma-HCH transport system permease protein
MGVQSLPLVLVTSILSGIVTSQQGGYQFTGSIPLYVLGSVVTSSVVLELGPVLTAVVVIGRVGARITAELGTMQVSEQIDALYSLGRDPVKVLAAPRILAGMPAMVLLVGISNLVGSLAGNAGRPPHRRPRPCDFPLRRAPLLAQLRLLLLRDEGLGLRLAHPAHLRAHGTPDPGRRGGVGRSTTASVVFMIIAVLVCDALFPPHLLELG